MDIFQDFRYALRVVVKKPSFSAIVILTLALGIGANTAIFSVVDAALLHGLPYREPDRIMQIWESTPREATQQREASYPDFTDWKNNNRTFESMAGYSQASVILKSADSSDMVPAALVSGDFFHVLGVDAAHGRVISTGEDQPGNDHVVVLTNSAWQRRFNSDQNLLGHAISVGSSTYTVVGILPEGFHFMPVGEPEMFLPLNPSQEIRARRFMHFVNVIGRVKEGVSLDQAQTDMNRIVMEIAQADPQGHENVTGKVLRLRDAIVGNVRPILMVLLIAVVFVLLIACANVANLFMVRSASRRKEMALRIALGANLRQLARQLLVESLVLSAIGGLLGVGLAQWGVAFLIKAIPSAQLVNMPYLHSVGLNRNVLVYTAAISLLSGIVFAMAPIVHSSRFDLHSALKEGGRNSGGIVRSRLRTGLVAAEIALTLMLLIGVGLMLKSTIRLLAVNPGFATDNLLTLRVSLVGQAYATPIERAAFQNLLLTRLRSLPGVAGAASVGKLPLNGGGDTATPIIDGRKDNGQSNAPSANVRTVSANYFETIGVPMVSGRAFNDRDTLNAPRAIVVNRAFARAFFGNDNPIDHQVGFIFDSAGKPWNIVGVVGDENVNTLDKAFSPVIYFPYQQDPESVLSIVVRTTSEPLALASAVRNEIRELDRTLPVSNMKSMTSIIDESPSTFIRRYPAMLIGVFATLAMILAGIGLYGVISYSVVQRTQELGVRLALGAQRADIFRLVIGQGLIVTVLGIVVGLGASLVLTRFLSSMLFDVRPYDPTIILSVVALLFGLSFIASYLPARRATRVDPLVALRYE